MGRGTEAIAARARAGLLQCLCGFGGAPDEDGMAAEPAVRRLAGGFMLAVVSQVMCLSALPLAGWMLAPRPGFAFWPLAALVAGSGIATLPASLLRDAFGRRAAFALGASLGIAGGAISAWALIDHQFFLLVLGAFWLGIAQGFGLFYRHDVALGSAATHRRDVALVMAAGAVAGILSPLLGRFAEQAFAPHVYAGSLAAAGLAHAGALALTRGLPLVEPREPGNVGLERSDWSAILWATVLAASAWYAMGRLMAAVPLGLSGCGISFTGLSGIVAWHVVAMYAPAALAASLVRRIGVVRLQVAATALLLACLALASATSTPTLLTLAYLAVGVGWSLSTVCATLRLAEARVSRGALALHDGALFAAALAGLLTA